MRTLILYSSKYGFTEKVAKRLGEHMDNDVVLKNCTKDFSIDLTKFDNVIIGSSIYVGKPSVTVLDFCESYQRLLMNKKLGFFVTGIRQEEAKGVIHENFPEDLVKHAKVKGYFGYGFDFDKMHFLDKVITRIVVKKSESEEKIHHLEIEKFANAFK